jgi:hypothetical protein
MLRVVRAGPDPAAHVAEVEKIKAGEVTTARAQKDTDLLLYVLYVGAVPLPRWRRPGTAGGHPTRYQSDGLGDGRTEGAAVRDGWARQGPQDRSGPRPGRRAALGASCRLRASSGLLVGLAGLLYRPVLDEGPAGGLLPFGAVLGRPPKLVWGRPGR